MSIWFSIHATIQVQPGVDADKLASALAEIAELAPQSVYPDQDRGRVTIETSHDMSHGTAERLATAVKALARDFGDGQATEIETKYEDDDRLNFFVGRKAAVIATLRADAAGRIRAIEKQLAAELAKLAAQPADAFVETAGWW
jgi:hypothetical protein